MLICSRKGLPVDCYGLLEIVFILEFPNVVFIIQWKSWIYKLPHVKYIFSDHLCNVTFFLIRVTVLQIINVLDSMLKYRRLCFVQRRGVTTKLLIVLTSCD